MKALDNRFYVKFMQLEIGLFRIQDQGMTRPRIQTRSFSFENTVEAVTRFLN